MHCICIKTDICGRNNEVEAEDWEPEEASTWLVEGETEFTLQKQFPKPWY